MSALANYTAFEEAIHAHWRPLPAVRAKASEQSGCWQRQSAGTGGIVAVAFFEQKWGYRSFEVVIERADAARPPVSVEWMQRVKAGFGRTMSRLPQVFGVSRQTLYNWLKGETPSPVHEARLRELAAAADKFQELGFTPTSSMLSRSVAEGKSFLDLMASGANGRDTAQRLVAIVRRGESSRSKLERLLAGRAPDLSAEDLSAPALDESA